MVISDLSVTRPVFASVISLLLIAFGLVAFDRLPLREYPDIDPPVVSIETTYPGAAANVVETRVTEIIEDRIAGVEGIRFVESSSADGRSTITVEFDVSRDIDAAANDIRDRVAGILDDIPEEADPPEIQKADSNDDVIMWLNLASDRLSVLELTDYAERYLTDRFSALDGVARVRVGGGLSYAMRIWLDRTALAARGLTVEDVENALRADNVELPAGSVESRMRQFTVRVDRSFRTPEDFRTLVLSRGGDGYLVRLGDVARIEKGAVEDRTFFRGNEVPMVGIGVIKQSRANTLGVTAAARAEAARINASLPDGMEIKQSYDTSVFVQGAIDEVYKTLFIATILVVTVIYLFLGSFRAMLIPAVAVPVSLIATFIILFALDFSINLLTLLALVLAIGLVVDDGIVVLENIHRRMDLGEPPLVAAFEGTRQVGFAVIATTLVLVAVFVPMTFLEGDIGRLFSEFALTMAAAVIFSSLVALTLSPMLASKILKGGGTKTPIARGVERGFAPLQKGVSARAGGYHPQAAVGWGGFSRAARRGRLVIAEDSDGIRAQGRPGRFLPDRQWPRRRVLRVYRKLYGRGRAAAHAVGREERGQSLVDPGAAGLRKHRILQYRYWHSGADRLVRTSIGLGDHGRRAAADRRFARRACVPRDAARIRRPHPKTGPVRDRRRHLPGTNELARSDHCKDQRG